MVLDVIHTVLEMTKSLSEVNLQQISEKIFEVATEMTREADLQQEIGYQPSGMSVGQGPVERVLEWSAK